MPYDKRVLERYNRLKNEVAATSLVAVIRQRAPSWTLAAPAPTSAVAAASETLGVQLPLELTALYAETDGIDDGFSIVWPAKAIGARNVEMRSTPGFRSLYMPFENLLFFGEEGNGDLYGFPIYMDGSVCVFNVLRWDHETDARPWAAGSVTDLILRRIAGMLEP